MPQPWQPKHQHALPFAVPHGQIGTDQGSPSPSPSSPGQKSNVSRTRLLEDNGQSTAPMLPSRASCTSGGQFDLRQMRIRLMAQCWLRCRWLGWSRCQSPPYPGVARAPLSARQACGSTTPAPNLDSRSIGRSGQDRSAWTGAVTCPSVPTPGSLIGNAPLHGEASGACLVHSFRSRDEAPIPATIGLRPVVAPNLQRAQRAPIARWLDE